MPIKQSRRISKKFRRPVSKKTKALTKRRYRRKRERVQERWKRIARRLQAGFFRSMRAFRIWIVVGVITALCSMFGFVLFSPLLEVREMTVVRTDARLDLEQVQYTLEPIFGKHMMFLTRREISNLLRPKMPDLVGLEINKVYPSQLIVTVELDSIIARLRIDDPESRSGSTDEQEAGTGGIVLGDYLTERGVYVRYNSVDNADELPLIRIVDWGVRPLPGPLFTKDFLDNMQFAEQALVQQFGHTIQSRTVFLLAKEFHLSLDQYDLWFDTRSTIADQMSRYRLFLESTDTAEVEEYIDLRLTDKIVYK